MNPSRRQAGKSLTAVALGLAALGYSSFALAADTLIFAKAGMKSATG